MNTSGEAADQVVRMSLEVGEAALKISGTGAKHLAVMLYAVLKEKKKTKGRARLETGNLNALRDWGYAKDYVECMWLILQHDTPEDFVIATGEMHTVREFCTLAFREAGIELEWEGEGVEERGRDRKTGNILVEVDPKYFRPAEVEQLLGDPTKAKTLLGWNPTSTPFEELVRIMVRHDMKYVKTPVHF